MSIGGGRYWQDVEYKRHALRTAAIEAVNIAWTIETLLQEIHELESRAEHD